MQSKTSEFIEKAISKHGDKYDYSLVNYIKACLKVIIICNTCKKQFDQNPNNHLQGQGCKSCKISAIKKSCTQEFIQKALQINNNNEFDYSLVNYIKSGLKVIIICNTCKQQFEQTPNSHLRGQGCKSCSIQQWAKSVTYTTQEFISKALQINNNNEFDYSLVNYINSLSKVIIICNTCKEQFEQVPSNHLRGQGCKRCSSNQLSFNNRKSIEEFINQAKSKHGDRYDYSLVEYVNCESKVIIICNKCKLHFNQPPQQHLNGSGCPGCVFKTEGLVSIYLQSKYETVLQKKFDDLLSQKGFPLRFDMYLPQFNTLIEIQGRQHYQQVQNWDLQSTQLHDQMKHNYCKLNKINLLKISQEQIWNSEYRGKQFDWRLIIDNFIEQTKQQIHIIQEVGIPSDDYK